MSESQFPSAAISLQQYTLKASFMLAVLTAMSIKGADV